FLSRFCVKSAEPSIIGGSNKRQPAGGHDGTTKTRPASTLLSCGEVVGDTQDRAPCDLSGIHVKRHEFSPRRFSTRQMFLGIPEARSSREGTRVGITSVLVGNNAHGLAQIVHIHDEQTERGIKCSARVVHPTLRSGQIY